MTFDDVRKFALTWPEVEDGTSYGTLVESQPKIFYFTDHYADYPIVLIRLSRAKRAIVEPFLRRRWRALASKAARTQYDAREGA
jgi:hypothetical protein